MSRWYRKIEGAVYDPKFRLIARRTNTHVCFVRDLFEHMMDYASESSSSKLDRFDNEVVAMNMDLETEVVVKIREAMNGVVLDGDVIRAWEKRQDYSTPRTRAFRERERVRAAGALVPLEAVPPVVPAEIIPPSVAPPLPLPVVPATVPVPAEGKRTRAKARTRIEEGAQPTDKDKAAAAEFGLSPAEFRMEWRKYRDHHLSVGSLMANWHAAWRKWLGKRDELMGRPMARSGAGGHESNFANAARELLGEIEDVTTGPGEVSAIASTLPDAAFATATYEGLTSDQSQALLDAEIIGP